MTSRKKYYASVIFMTAIILAGLAMLLASVRHV